MTEEEEMGKEQEGKKQEREEMGKRKSKGGDEEDREGGARSDEVSIRDVIFPFDCKRTVYPEELIPCFRGK